MYGTGEDADKLVGFKQNGVQIKSYAYDELNRVTSETLNTTAPVTTTYGYADHATEEGRTSALVETLKIGENPQYRYEYDANGNIVKEFCGNTLLYQYGYDGKNQLVSFSYPGLELDDAPAQYVYFYDNQGNLTSVVLTNGMEMETVSAYGYTDASWGDLLTSFNGAGITYDAIGNPLSYYDGRTFSWQNGRQLAVASVAEGFALFEYNEEGMRVKKTVDGSFAGVTTYVYDGNLLLREKKTNPVTGAVIHDLYFTYDEAGRPFSMTDTYETLYYAYDLYGNVKYLYDAYGNVNAEYIYNDPWGKSVTFLGAPFELASYNPFTYKGYYYDAELEMYYCGSRYYDPDTCRWLNADGYVSTGQGILGNNMFAYCLNNPVMLVDVEGELAYPAEIHNAVVRYVANQYKHKYPQNKIYMEKRVIFSNAHYGRVDLVDSEGYIWDVKRDTPNHISRGIRQVRWYVSGSIVGVKDPLKVGDYSIFAGRFYYTSASGTYLVTYRNAGCGVIAYDYVLKKPKPEPQPSSELSLEPFLGGILVAGLLGTISWLTSGASTALVFALV